MNKFYVYCFTNIKNNKIYIGKTNNLIKRKSYHKFANGGCKYFHSAIKKYGFSNFDFKILATFNNEIDALNSEIYYIKQYNSDNKNYGYNLTSGGEGITGYKHSKKSIKKISQAMTAENNPKAKLTIKLADQIRDIYHNENINYDKLAVMFDVKITTIYRIVNNLSFVNKTYIKKQKYVGSNIHSSKLNEEKVKEIMELISIGLSNKEIAFKYNVDPSTISNIKNNKSWKRNN